MLTRTSTTATSPRQPERRRLIAALALLILLTLAVGLGGTLVAADVVVAALAPRGQVHPQSLLTYLHADYGAWPRSPIPIVPLNPQAVAAIEQDRAEPTAAAGDAIVPPASLPNNQLPAPIAEAATATATATPTSTPSPSPTPASVAQAATATPTSTP